LAAIIIPGQSGTYRHLRGYVTGLLAESGQNELWCLFPVSRSAGS